MLAAWERQSGEVMEYKRTTVYSREELTRLLHPQSIAVIGASTRAGSFGKRCCQHGSTTAAGTTQ